MKKHLQDSIRIVLKSMAGIQITISIFLILKTILGNPSSLPESIREQYPPSFLARHGREILGTHEPDKEKNRIHIQRTLNRNNDLIHI